MSVKHNKDGGGNAEIKKELQEVKKETQEVKTAGESTAALLALSFKAQIAQDRAAKTNIISDAMILQSAEVIEYPEYEDAHAYNTVGEIIKYNGRYYFSYSTGDTHLLCYAIGDNPYGPFTYQGVIQTPVVGWTTHHAIVEFKGKWYLFHHDCVPSGGKTWLRSMKVCELQYDADGKIITIDGMDE